MKTYTLNEIRSMDDITLGNFIQAAYEHGWGCGYDEGLGLEVEDCCPEFNENNTALQFDDTFKFLEGED